MFKDDSINQRYNQNKYIWENERDKNSPAAVQAHADNERIRQQHGIFSDDYNASQFENQFIGSNNQYKSNKYMRRVDNTYDSAHKQAIDNIRKKLENFTYNPSNDPTFNAYKDMYIRQGKSAQDNTYSDLSALSGGRNNSWASAATAQVGQAYNQKINDLIPQLAEQQYNRLLNQLNTDIQLDNIDYSRFDDNRNMDYQLGLEYNNRYQHELDRARQNRNDYWVNENNKLDTDYKAFNYDLEKQYAPVDRLQQQQMNKIAIDKGLIEVEWLPKQLQQAFTQGEISIEQARAEIQRIKASYGGGSGGLDLDNILGGGTPT